MSLVEVVLKHERGIQVLLVHVVGLVSVECVFLVHGSRGHEGNVGVMLLVENEGVLHVSLVAVGLHVDAVKLLALQVFSHVVVELL